LCLGYLLLPSESVEIPPVFTQPHIARVNVYGAVESMSDSWYQQLEKLYDNQEAKALVLVIDSPGGAVSVADAGYSLLKRIHQRMPVVTVVENTAASAGYMLATTADVIIARETSIVGSIGVLLQIPVFKGLLKNIGVEYRNVGVGDNLDVVPFQGLTDFTNKYLDLAGEDSYEWFRSIVQYERRLSDAQLKKVIGGRIFLGHEAESLGLIDGFGGVPVARQWLQSHDANLSDDLPLVEYAQLVQ
jgi:protease-4